MRRLIPLAVVLVPALAVAAPLPEEPKKKDIDLLQGRWKVESAERNGEKAEEIINDVLVIKEKAISIETPSGREEKATFKIDDGKKPKSFDMTVSVNGDDMTLPGIYKLDGDTFTLCFADPAAERPTEFSSKNDDKTKYKALIVLKREKK